MKIKVKPDDFYVEEKINVFPKKKGKFALYRLEKTYWNTLDLIHYLEERYHFRKFQRLGLKDRYSHSIQYLTNSWVRKEPITEKNFSLQFLGFIDEPLRNENLLGNFFRITLRDLKKEEGEKILLNLPSVKEFGFPNYYDEQRMGEARHKEGFLAKMLIRSDYESALRLYLATPSPYDEKRVKKMKVFLKENWGKWEEAETIAPKEYQPVLRFLKEKGNDYKSAVKKIRRNLLTLFINSYQAYLWNEILRNFLKGLPGIELFPVAYRYGELLFYKELPEGIRDYLSNLSISSPAPRAEFPPDLSPIVEEVLKKEGLKVSDLKLKLKMRGIYFKPYLRKAITIPQDLEISGLEEDEIYPGKMKLRINFFLPPGSYATVLIKRLTI
ncbi:MAG: tRNA pseudouridine(13) synthase TruD [candidate division WOR-3 bacterium]